MMTSEHESPAVSDRAGWPAGMPPATGPTFDEATAPRLTPREAAARRLLALGALKKVLDEEIARTRKEDGAAFTMAGQREPAALPDGTPLGLVRADKGTEAGWKITDPGRFLAWVRDVDPDAVLEKVVTTYEVDPQFVDAVLTGLTADGGLVDEETGEVGDPPPGVTFVAAGPPKLNVTPDKGAPAAVRAYLAPVLAALEVGA